MTGPSTAGSSSVQFLTGWRGAALILTAFWLLLSASLWNKSVTTDEIVHVTAGYSYWHFNDYRLNPENGNLPQRIEALPLLFGPYLFPSTDLAAWRTSDEWAVGEAWFYQMGHDVAGMLHAGRAAAGLLAVALGALVWAWSRRLFGPWGGLLSLLLFVFDPSILANGALMTSDTACALFFLAATWAWWRTLHGFSPGRILASGLLVGCLFVAKMSAVLIMPLAVVLAAVRILDGRPLPLSCGSWHRKLTGRGGLALAFLGTGLLQFLITVLVIWASYGFRYSAFAGAGAGSGHLRDPWEHVLGIPEPVEILDQLELRPDQHQAAQRIFVRMAVRTNAWTPEALAAVKEIRETVLDPVQAARLGQALAVPPARTARLFDFLRRHRLLPEAYVYGYATTWKYSQSRGAFLNGKFSLFGWRSFFPYTFLVKTPLSIFGVIVLAAVAGIVGWRRAPYATLPLWILLVGYWGAAIFSHVDIGHRHILATYPPLFVLCGAAGAWAERARNRLPAVLATVCVVCLGGEIAYRFPNYLAYFNPLDGGPTQAYRHLVDSSLDWGQDLPGVRAYLSSHPGPDPAYLAYFGAGSPEYYQIPAGLLYPRTQAILVLSYPSNRAGVLREEIQRSHPDCEVMATGTQGGVETVALLKRPAALKPGAGTYFISATLLQPLEYNASGPWGPWTGAYEATYRKLAAEAQPLLEGTPGERRQAFLSRPLSDWEKTLDDYDAFRFARLTAYLRKREPSDTVNFSILIYHLTEADLRLGLEGPLAN